MHITSTSGMYKMVLISYYLGKENDENFKFHVKKFFFWNRRLALLSAALWYAPSLTGSTLKRCGSAYSRKHCASLWVILHFVRTFDSAFMYSHTENVTPQSHPNLQHSFFTGVSYLLCRLFQLKYVSKVMLHSKKLDNFELQ